MKRSDDPIGRLHTTEGIYRTKRDGGVKYTYTVGWTDRGRWCTWYAEVSRDGERKGRLNGSLLIPAGASPEMDIRKLIQYSIEELVQIAE